MEENKYKIPFLIQGYGGGPEEEEQHQPVEAPEGVVGGGGYPTGVSVTTIRAIDLLCEGETEGLVEGRWKYEGRLGNIGYDSATYVPYPEKNIGGTSVRYLRSIFWNDTPVVDETNAINFQQIEIKVSNGLPNGYPTASSDELTVSRGLSERLRGPNRDGAMDEASMAAFSKVYQILNTDCTAVNVNIKVTQLSKSNRNIDDKDHLGDVTATSVKYGIYYKPLFSKPTVIDGETFSSDSTPYTLAKKVHIYGKISYGYIRSTRINFPEKYTNVPSFLGWSIRIYRYTVDSTSSDLRNMTYVDSITEIYGEKFCYPNSSIIAQKFSAEYFSQIPSRTFDMKLLKVKIPSNYDPIKKTYDGVWDGTFKKDENGIVKKFWTDNPAWCFYDLVTNNRYGLGKYVDEALVDKWTLYEIGRYCDTLVSDGRGGVEPRFRCNLYLTSREEAYRVLNDMASIFRGLVYYAAGGIFTSQDALKQPICQFTNANVEDGNFIYSSSSKRVRHSVAIVHYNDENNHWKPSVEYVEDTTAIKRYGIRELELASLGSTTRGQALRYGRWGLISEQLETDAVSFVGGLEATYLRPGDVFRVHDYNRKKNRYGGRLFNINHQNNAFELTLDGAALPFKPDMVYNLSLLTPTFNYDTSQVNLTDSSDSSNIRRSMVQKVSFYGNAVTSGDGMSTISIPDTKLDSTNYLLSGQLVWAIEASGQNNDENFENQWEYYRAIRIEEKDDNKFAIAGIQYSENKFLEIESGLHYETEVATVLPTPVSAIQLSTHYLSNQGTIQEVKYNLITSPTSVGINSFLVYAKLGNWEPSDFSESYPEGNPQVSDKTPNEQYLINILSADSPSGSFFPVLNGTYNFRAYSRNMAGVPATTPASASITIAGLDIFRSVTINSLGLAEATRESSLGLRSTGSSTNISPTFVWNVGVNENQNHIFTDNLPFRITIRKPNYARALNPATSLERPSTDQYQPSYVIYNEVTGYIPEDSSNLSYSYDIQTNIANFINNRGESGVFREFDIVVEAHTLSGQSSAGGNFITDTRGTYNGEPVKDSAFTNPNGYDIFYFRNPKPEAISLTEDHSITRQWFNTEGEIKIDVSDVELPRDIAGCYIFSSKVNFTAEEAKNGITTDGQIVRGFDVPGNNAFIIGPPRELVAVREGYMAVGFYDSIDEEIRNTIKKSDPTYDFKKELNLSNTVLIHRKLEEDVSRFQAWVMGSLLYNHLWKDGGGFFGDTEEGSVSAAGYGYNLAGIEWRKFDKNANGQFTKISIIVKWVPGNVPVPQRAFRNFQIVRFNDISSPNTISSKASVFYYLDSEINDRVVIEDIPIPLDANGYAAQKFRVSFQIGVVGGDDLPLITAINGTNN